jgi:hypothetical protein
LSSLAGLFLFTGVCQAEPTTDVTGTWSQTGGIPPKATPAQVVQEYHRVAKLAADSALNQQSKTGAETWSRSRAALTSRCDIEFPK